MSSTSLVPLRPRTGGTVSAALRVWEVLSGALRNAGGFGRVPAVHKQLLERHVVTVERPVQSLVANVRHIPHGDILGKN